MIRVSQHNLVKQKGLVYYRLLISLLFIIVIGFHKAVADPVEELKRLTYITEAYPPFNFIEQGSLVGISVDLLLEATQAQSVDLDIDMIKVYPWARGYQQALKGPDIVLFGTTRTEAREKLFKWAGPIATTNIVLLALKESNIKISTLDDIKKYRVGGIRDDIGEQLVLATGYPKAKFITQANAGAVVNMLAKQRMDLLAYGEFVAKWFIRQRQLNSNEFESVYLLKEGKLYFAFSKDVMDPVVEELQKGIDKVKDKPGVIGESLYQDILMRYM